VSNPNVIWEGIYGQGQQLNRYPFDQVVSFVYRHAPRQKPRQQVSILEIGCGAGNNLWFAAREGFSVAGIDVSASAIEYARKRFAEESLQGDFRVGDFGQLPFEDERFDLVIDRGALTCSGLSAARGTIAEVHRVLLPGGKFYFNPYSDRHSSYVSGQPGPDGLTTEISAGTMTGIGAIYFYSKREMLSALSEGWTLLSLRHVEYMEELGPQYLAHAEWIAVAQKT
jgi:ubiquinone/menaquinone biosynthesis C-methylase UbiE